jgi:hypothetical protein
VEQADRLAVALTGQDAGVPGVPYWWSDQYGLKFQGVGGIAGADQVRVSTWEVHQGAVALSAKRVGLTGVAFSAAPAVMRLRADLADGNSLSGAAARLTDVEWILPS